MEEHNEHVKTAMKIQFEERARTMKRDFDIEIESLEGEINRQKREVERVSLDFHTKFRLILILCFSSWNKKLLHSRMRWL